MNDINDSQFFDRNENPITKPNDRQAKKRTSVYGVITENQKILLVKANYSTSWKWELPGGGVDEDEDETSALKRELLEEANCEVEEIGDCLSEIHVNLYADDLDEYFYNTGKFYKINKWRIINKSLDHEIEESRMFDFKEIDLNNIRLDHQSILRQIVNEDN